MVRNAQSIQENEQNNGAETTRLVEPNQFKKTKPTGRRTYQVRINAPRQRELPSSLLERAQSKDGYGGSLLGCTMNGRSSERETNDGLGIDGLGDLACEV